MLKRWSVEVDIKRKKKKENKYTHTKNPLSFLSHIDSQQPGKIDGGLGWNWIQLVGGRQPQLQASYENNTT